MKILIKNKWRKEVHERNNAKQDLPVFFVISQKKKKNKHGNKE